MEYRKFGKNEELISLLGFGAWGIGKTLWIGAEDNESKKALHSAIENGVNFIDSALVYGNGHSERLIGEVEKESGKKLFITSKIPSKRFEWPAKDTSQFRDSFPAQHMIACTEKSLRNLKREYIDLQQFHVWNDKWAHEDEWKETILKLKQDGKVRYFGISINDHQPENGIEAAKSGLIDSFQVIFNLFDQSPVDVLFPFCKKNNIAVIARVPFDEGSLTGNITPDTLFPKGDWRNNYFKENRKQEVWLRVQEIQKDIAGSCETIAEAALRFIISFPEVATVIPGMRKEKNLIENVMSINKGILDNEMMAKLKLHCWIRNFYG